MQVNFKSPVTTEHRRQQFQKWWRKNRNNQLAHTWLAYHAKRIAYGYNLNPNAFDDIKVITKRYHNSEYKRFNRPDAFQLWRLTHPLYNERLERLVTTAEFLIEQKSTQKDKKK